MDLAQLFAEYLIPGLVTNCWFLVVMDILTAKRLFNTLFSSQTPDWVGNLIILLLVGTAYFTGFIISSMMLDISRPIRRMTASKVRGLSDLVKEKKDLLLKLGIIAEDVDPSKSQGLTEAYNGLLVYVWKNSDDQILNQFRLDRNRLVLARSMVIPLLLFAIVFPVWETTLLESPLNIDIGIFLGLVSLYTLRLNWRKGFQQGERTVRLARQYLQEIEDQQESIVKAVADEKAT